MLEVIREAAGGEEDCVYLPGQRSRIRYRLIASCRLSTYSQMLERGWRRFGRVFFRPVCAACEECRSLRLEVAGFQPSRSMRRNLRRNRDLEVILRPASASYAHLALYNRYHADMEERRGWGEKSITPIDYVRTFVDGRQGFGHEMLYVAGDRLLGVALVDILPPVSPRISAAISAVYCYYEPQERRRGLGVFSLLQHLELARERRIPHVYLGYWVEGNASMRYKADYRPHEILRGRPDFEQAPEWERVGADQAIFASRSSRSST